VPRRIDDLIEKLGGEVLVSRLWAEQKLAYPIHGHTKGTYWLAYFRIDSGAITELNHQTKLDESILRSLVLVIDPRLVDTMVAHALGGDAPTEDAPEKPATETEKTGKSPATEAATAESGGG
jgi:small subunit ribosomal protein S6